MATAHRHFPPPTRPSCSPLPIAVAREKMIDKGIVIEAIEDAIQRAARARYGAENDIRAKLDPETGDLRLWRVVEVVEQVEDYFKQVDLAAGQKLQKDANDRRLHRRPAARGSTSAASTRSRPSRSSSRRSAKPTASAQYQEFKDRARRDHHRRREVRSNSATSSSTSAAPRVSSAATSRSRAN